MKKFLSILLVVGVLMSAMSFSVSAAEYSDEEVAAFVTMMNRADVNNDGAYSTLDASKLLKAAAGIELAEEDYDIDLDGQVTLLDAQKMLRVAADLDSVVGNDVLLKLFTEKLNSVKTTKPGFTRTTTLVCPSIKVTTTGAPDKKLNVTNMEYKDYVNTLVSVMNSFPYNTLLDDATKKELEEMKKSAVEVYQPQTEKKTVAKTSNSHYTYFPVNNLGWSCKLEMSDIKSIKQTIVGGNIVITITLADYTYGKGEYPVGSSGFADRQKLPYGKIFNIPALSETDGSIINSMAFKNGVVVLTLDGQTADVVSADYSYSYISSITSPKTEGSDLVMKTVTTANNNENYVMN
ncbi:MAG: hypothetical protein J6Q83_05435 [Clostridia bacterium]|nr:hypothetical protein [Clostridia bacterium]